MRVFIILLISLSTFSCSRAIGYFVVMWPPDESAVELGEIVRVISQSELRNIYVIEKKEDKIREEIPRTSGRFFKKRKDAEKFFEQYEPYVDMFAYSERSLNIRTSPDVSAGREYRLRPSQVIKVIGKMEEPSDVNNIIGHWIEVLTEDGFTGYCFDRYLTFYKRESTISIEDNEEMLIDIFFDNIWYPSSFGEMIESGRVVVERLRTGEGAFPDRDNKKIVIRTRTERVEFPFDDILFLNNNTVSFLGSPIELIFYSAEKIYIKYTHRGVDHLFFYTILEMPVDRYIEAELVRRNTVLNQFFARGRHLTSDLYGIIRLEGRRGFTWAEYSNLIPDVIPFNFGNSGTVRSNYFLEDDADDKFDGVISFLFDAVDREMVFAYLFVDNGVQFTYVPESSIAANVISSVPADSHVFYFRQGSIPQDE